MTTQTYITDPATPITPTTKNRLNDILNTFADAALSQVGYPAS